MSGMYEQPSQEQPDPNQGVLFDNNAGPEEPGEVLQRPENIQAARLIRESTIEDR